MFTQRLKISVVFTLKFRANCIHKTSFKSLTTSKNFPALSHFPVYLKPVAPQAVSVTFRSWRNTFEHNVRRLSSQETFCAWERALWISWWCSFLVFFEPCSFLCKDEEEALLLLSFGSKCILGCDWISP